MNDTTILHAARQGDSEAFSQLAEPYRRELLIHCYRMLGAIQETEGIIQETFLQAWRQLDTYLEQAPFRVWLYKIATNICLDTLEERARRIFPPESLPASSSPQPDLTPMSEAIWLEPIPDELLPDPEADFTRREDISLGFLTLLQELPPRQRATFILRDVLRWRAEEVGQLLDTSVSAVNSALYRARLMLENQKLPSPLDEGLNAILDQYVTAWENADVEGVIALLKPDAIFTMPPIPSWYHRRGAIAAMLREYLFAGNRWRLKSTRANRQPAFGIFRLNPDNDTYEPFAIQVLTLDGQKITRIDNFLDPAIRRFFDLGDR